MKETNFEHIKKKWDFNKFSEGYSFCGLIQQCRGTLCVNVDCKKCKRWLQKEYVEPILDKTELKYLGNFTKPFRNKIRYIQKCSIFGGEYLHIVYKNGEFTNLPNFRENSMYKGMELLKKYSLSDLGI